MTFNTINGIVVVLSNLILHASIGILLLSLDKTLGTIAIGSFLIKKLAQTVYLYNEIKERTQQINNLISSMNKSIDVDNVIEFKKDDKK
jgi:hypothetical protein